MLGRLPKLLRMRFFSVNEYAIGSPSHLASPYPAHQRGDIVADGLYSILSPAGARGTLFLGPEASVAEALALVRRSEIQTTIATSVFVCRAPLEPPTGKYLGLVHLQQLLREPPHASVGDFLDKDTEPVPVNASLAQVTRTFATYDLVSIPVVDDQKRLRGAVTVDDVLDHILPDHWRGDRHGVTHG